MLGKINLALNEYRMAIEKENDSSLQIEFEECVLVEKNYNEARNLMQEQRVSEAITYINQVLKVVPEWREVKILQIECLAKMGLADKVFYNQIYARKIDIF